MHPELGPHCIESIEAIPSSGSSFFFEGEQRPSLGPLRTYACFPCLAKSPTALTNAKDIAAADESPELFERKAYGLLHLIRPHGLSPSSTLPHPSLHGPCRCFYSFGTGEAELEEMTSHSVTTLHRALERSRARVAPVPHMPPSPFLSRRALPPSRVSVGLRPMPEFVPALLPHVSLP